ncbi:MAG: serine protease [Verrucomicrobia bacterium]|nr:serine protease [Verrucomicrobiota bacterium]MDA1005555.1 serine protease [Verrucomicrobiota bacterium]
MAHHIPSPRLTALLVALPLLVASCGDSDQPDPGTADPPPAEDVRVLKELKASVAERQSARDVAVAKLHRLQRQQKAQEASIAALTTEVSGKQEALALRMAADAANAAKATINKTTPKPRPETGGKVALPDKFVAVVTPRVVIIEGDRSSGTGFLCASEDQVWVYTAAHVLSGNRKISVRDSKGQVYREFEYMECAEGIDLVRLKPKDADFQGLELVSAEDAPKIGDVIVAIGNSLGAGSLSAEPGHVRSIAEDMWEVDAEIIPGNSGGPVLSLDNGKVVGIVTHLIIDRGEGQNVRSQEPKVTRFAARLDKKWEWRRMAVPRFVKEWDYVEKMNRDSSVAWAAIYLMHTGPSGRTNAEAAALAEEIIAEERNHIHVQRMDGWLKRWREAGRLQRSALIDEGNEIITRILEEIQLKDSDPKAEDFSWYHRESYMYEQEWRNELSPPRK